MGCDIVSWVEVYTPVVTRYYKENADAVEAHATNLRSRSSPENSTALPLSPRRSAVDRNEEKATLNGLGPAPCEVIELVTFIRCSCHCLFERAVARVPGRREVHLIHDNYGTHTHAEVKEWLAAHPRYHLHFTPTSASWLNLVERFFGEITDRRLRRETFKSVPELVQAIAA